jgi:uncharacterized protein (TIGR02300 family)
MGRPELGTKCICVSCAERFYDLNRLPATCPKCGAVQPPVQLRMFRPARVTTAFARPTRQPAPVVAEEDVDLVSTPDAEDEEDAPEVDDDVDEDLEVIPDHDATPI